MKTISSHLNEKENSSFTLNLKEILVGAATDNDIKI